MSEDIYTNDLDRRFTLRMRKDLFEVVKLFAQVNKRAIGKEIEYALGQYYINEVENKMDKKSKMFPVIVKHLTTYDPFCCIGILDELEEKAE